MRIPLLGAWRKWHLQLLQRQLTISSAQRYSSTRPQSESQYIIDRVKSYDHENYILMMLAPKRSRYPMFVVHAVNVEISLALESVTDTKTAAGRFTFWHDAVERIYSGQQSYDHPVLQQLACVYDAGLIDNQQCKTSLVNLIKARQAIAGVTHFSNMEQLEMYAEHTKTSLQYLTLSIAGYSDVNTDHAASHVGRCSGIVNAIRSTPYLVRKNQLLLPQSILSKHGVSQNDVVRGRENVKEAVFDIASTAKIHLDHAKELLTKVPKEAKPYFLQMALCEYHLEHLRKCDFNIFSSQFLQKDNMLGLKMWWANRKMR